MLLVQLPVPNNPLLNTALAAGYLKVYAEAQGLADCVEIAILPRAIADHAGDAALVEAIVARRPSVLGLSLYTWNSERSLAITLRVKARLPELLVVVGGPEVQRDNRWLLEHPAVDVAVIGEGEQTFYELLQAFYADQDSTLTAKARRAHGLGDLNRLRTIPGLAFRDGAELVFTTERTGLDDLAVIPSPYLAGYLDVPPAALMMVEISRWCPYACSFCLYGRNMGPKLGSRYFGLDRVLAEIRWARTHGVQRIHFVEANLNLVPLFWPLMHALAEINADRALTFYAELRGEHLTDAVVDALAAASVRVVEVGLQTANPVALRASQRRTDLAKWAAGTRRLYRRDIEVLLDVIVGLPEDDEAGIRETLAFIARADLGPYDVFTLQVLPGTVLRQQAAQFGLTFQDRPPYYVLGTARLDFTAIRGLRRQLKEQIDLDPDVVEGMPLLRESRIQDSTFSMSFAPFASLRLNTLANQVDVELSLSELVDATPTLAAAIEANPSTIFDVYLSCDVPPPAEELATWRAALPFTPGYLDRVAVYGLAQPEPPYKTCQPAHLAGAALVLHRGASGVRRCGANHLALRTRRGGGAAATLLASSRWRWHRALLRRRCACRGASGTSGAATALASRERGDRVAKRGPGDPVITTKLCAPGLVAVQKCPAACALCDLVAKKKTFAFFASLRFNIHMSDKRDTSPLTRYAAARLAATLSPLPYLERMPYSLRAEPLVIPTADGVSLGATLLTRSRSSLVIVGHGFASTQQSRSVVWLAEQLAERYDVLTFDWRGYGRSGGFATFGGHERADLAAVIGWARSYRRLADQRDRREYGRPDHACGPRQRRGWFPAPRSHHHTERAGRLCAHRRSSPIYAAPPSGQSQRAPDRADVRLPHGRIPAAAPLDVVERIKLPWLLVHGTRDSTVPYRNAELLHAAAPHATLRRYDGADHAITGLRAYDAKRLLADLHEHLDGHGLGDMLPFGESRSQESGVRIQESGVRSQNSEWCCAALRSFEVLVIQVAFSCFVSINAAHLGVRHGRSTSHP
ncbi:radical SAM protein [Candidatus Gracilibacteria bacterium]|nr:radical SAM protein [Candidatus Gracilibacteria bacterium]